MKVTVLLVLTYIYYCVCYRTRPCKYFQLNAAYFDSAAGIFSKIRMDQLIPPPWRLAQCYDDGAYTPPAYPVFVKPEWSQNAHGVQRADDAAALQRIRRARAPAAARHLIQQAAAAAHEFEIFSIRHADPERYAVLTVTRVDNATEAYPVNSIYNPDTRYHDITASFSAAEHARLWEFVRRMATFAISRVSVRADSTAALLGGDFQVIEVNLFLPMPINLLDRRHSWRARYRMICTYTRALALVTRHRDRLFPSRPVFSKIMRYQRRARSMNPSGARP